MDISKNFKKAVSFSLATGILLTSSVSVCCFAEEVAAEKVEQRVINSLQNEKSNVKTEKDQYWEDLEENATKKEKKLKEGNSNEVEESSWAKFLASASAAYDSAKNKASSAYDSAKQSVSTNYEELKSKLIDWWNKKKAGENAADGKQVNKYLGYLVRGGEKIADNWKSVAGASAGAAGVALMAWLAQKVLSGGNGTATSQVNVKHGKSDNSQEQVVVEKETSILQANATVGVNGTNSNLFELYDDSMQYNKTAYYAVFGVGVFCLLGIVGVNKIWSYIAGCLGLR